MDARVEGRELAAHGLEGQAHGDVGLLQEPARVMGRKGAEREGRGGAVDEGGGILGAEGEVG